MVDLKHAIKLGVYLSVRNELQDRYQFPLERILQWYWRPHPLLGNRTPHAVIENSPTFFDRWFHDAMARPNGIALIMGSEEPIKKVDGKTEVRS